MLTDFKNYLLLDSAINLQQVCHCISHSTCKTSAEDMLDFQQVTVECWSPWPWACLFRKSGPDIRRSSEDV